MVDHVGTRTDKIVFETDVPNPTSIRADEVNEAIESKLGTLPESVRRELIWQNGARRQDKEMPGGR